MIEGAYYFPEISGVCLNSYRPLVWVLSIIIIFKASSSSQLMCRAAFNAAYSHTGGQARELVRS